MQGKILANRYELEATLGKGGMAQTFAAHRLMDDLPVVVKALHFGQMQNWKYYDLFQREVRILQNLNHPAIPKFLDHFESDESGDKWFYLVQERVPGENLGILMEQGWHPSSQQIQSIALQVLAVLEYLHGLSPPVIHRDLKPSNLILNQDKIYLVDFGAVQDVLRPEGSSTVVGTFGYMAPEQFTGRALPASDLYALGATLVHLLSGRSPSELPQRELRLDFKAYVNCSRLFSEWLEHMLEPAPERRFKSAEQAKQALLNPKVPTAPRSSGSLQRAPLAEQELSPPKIYRPSGSQIQVQHQGDKLQLKIPAPGLKGNNIFMAGFATVWLSFVAFWTTMAAQGSLFFALFSIPFWIVGLFMARMSILNAFTHTVLSLDPEQYQLESQTLSVSRTQTGLTHEIRAIGPKMSYKANNVPVFVIHLDAGGKTHNFGQGLSRAEQEWVQAEILNYLCDHWPASESRLLLAHSESLEA